MSKPVVAVVGSAMMDLTAYSAILPNPGQTVVGQEFTTGFGGKGANQAVACAIAGAEVFFIGKLGRDVFGDSIYKNFQERGLQLDFLERSEAPTGVAHIWVDEDGENRIIIIPGANHEIDANLVSSAIAKISDLKIVIGQCEIKQAVTIAAFKSAKARGAITILNPAPYEVLSNELLEFTDWIIPNEIEYAEMGQLEANLILTEGAKGARHLNSELKVSALEVEAVDTTGAGDCFVGTFAATLAKGEPLEVAMRTGCIAASLSVTKKGAQSSYATYAEISTFS
ncbi:MAG: ribokinase [Candidatus Nanopelagicaceae bacterium]